MSTMTPEFRASYPNLMRAKRNDLNGKDEYSVVALFPKEADLSKLKALAQEALEKKFGKDQKSWPANLRSPFRDQADRAKTDPETGKRVLPPGHVEGAKYLNLKTERKPGVVNAKVEPIIDESELYAGCWCRATVTAFAYDQKGNRGVSFSLQNVQKTREGDPLGSRQKPEDEFSAFQPAGGASEDSSIKGAASIFD